MLLTKTNTMLAGDRWMMYSRNYVFPARDMEFYSCTYSYLHIITLARSMHYIIIISY